MYSVAHIGVCVHALCLFKFTDSPVKPSACARVRGVYVCLSLSVRDEPAECPLIGIILSVTSSSLLQQSKCVFMLALHVPGSG